MAASIDNLRTASRLFQGCSRTSILCRSWLRGQTSAMMRFGTDARQRIDDCLRAATHSWLASVMLPQSASALASKGNKQRRLAVSRLLSRQREALPVKKTIMGFAMIDVYTIRNQGVRIPRLRNRTCKVVDR